jgi:hypothetical protein
LKPRSSRQRKIDFRILSFGNHMARNAGRVRARSQFRSRLATGGSFFATHCAEYPLLGAGRGGVAHGPAERGVYFLNLS